MSLAGSLRVRVPFFATMLVWTLWLSVWVSHPVSVLAPVGGRWSLVAQAQWPGRNRLL